jgi:hypothetical protein
MSEAPSIKAGLKKEKRGPEGLTAPPREWIIAPCSGVLTRFGLKYNTGY